MAAPQKTSSYFRPLLRLGERIQSFLSPKSATATGKGKTHITPKKQDKKADSMVMPVLNPYNFYRYYIPQYAGVLYRHKQLGNFTIWAFSELLRTIYYPVLQYQFLLWDQAIIMRNPVTELFPIFVGAIALGKFISTCSQYLQSNLLCSTKDSINKMLLVESVHTNKGADIIDKDNKKTSSNPLDVNAKYSYMANYIQNIGSMCLMAVISPFALMPTMYSIVHYDLIVPAVYTVIGCGLITAMANRISRFSSHYINDIAVAQSDIRNVIDKVSNNGYHNHPNARAISKGKTLHLVNSLKVSRVKYNQVESFIDLVGKLMLDVCKPIIGALLIYPTYLAGKITLEYYTLLVATLSSIPVFFSRYITSNTGLHILQQGATVMKHFDKNYLDQTKDITTAVQRLPSHYSGNVKYNYSSDNLTLKSTNITLRQPYIHDSVCKIDLVPKHSVVMGVNGIGKSTLFKILDSSHPSVTDPSSLKPVIVSITQHEIANLEGDNIIVALLKFWPFSLPVPEPNFKKPFQEHLTEQSTIIDGNGNSIDKEHLLEDIWKFLCQIEYNVTYRLDTPKEERLEKLLAIRLGGSSLSGGQNSLILLAIGLTIAKHASQKNPVLVLLDELRAAVDERKRALFTKCIQAFLKGKPHINTLEIIHDSYSVLSLLDNYSATSCCIVSKDKNNCTIVKQMYDSAAVKSDPDFLHLTGQDVDTKLAVKL